MPKFFIENENITDNYAKIVGNDVSHITKVLRLSLKSIIIVCDGNGNDYEGKIEEIGKDSITLSLLNKFPCKSEPALKVTLFQGIPKSVKMEYIIEKCTELGMECMVPIMTKRTVVKLDDKKTEEKKLLRWRKIASESVKQCGRGVIPEIHSVCSLKGIAHYLKELDFCIVAYEKEKNFPLKEILVQHKSIRNIGIIIGPEGGFEEDEIEYLKSLGVQSFTLGERILRTETAGHAVLSAIMYEFDEF